MYTHILMLCRKFEQILIKFGFIMNFEVAEKSDEVLVAYSKAAKVVAAILKWGESYLVTLPRY